jgi:hypothetical protein
MIARGHPGFQGRAEPPACQDREVEERRFGAGRLPAGVSG